MRSVTEQAPQALTDRIKEAAVCYHCGAACITGRIKVEEKFFCCEGCKLVYEIINENGLCDYYNMQSHPGLTQIKPVRTDKFAFLENEDIASKLYQFTNGDLTIITLYIPAIHCSSCMWLLEHLNRLDAGIAESRINFSTKEVTIHFSLKKTSFRKVAELLATIGYEPYICLDDAGKKEVSTFNNKQRIIKLGIAGFCFGNIMMMSFPEYLSGKAGIEHQYTYLFRYLNLFLSLPVLLYSATEFYIAAWKGIKQKMLNIDAPIVLALIITFTRSVYEILTNTGAGYLDSMSGIVFFMLVGRIVQERTYRSLSFTRDYKDYFPIAVNVRTEDGIISKQLKDIKKNDIVILHNEEIIPADAIVLNDNAMIDYSFVTGEAEPVKVKRKEIVYAGGKQAGEELILQVIKPVAGSYLTNLWNHYAFKKDKTETNNKKSAIHILSRYFTIILFSLTMLTSIYWYYHDRARIITSVSAMLIVACPCALLLAATFTNSNILRIFSLNGLYLRGPTVIEQMAKTNHIIFDKTGTITDPWNKDLACSGYMLSEEEKDILYSVVCQSNHPNSVTLTRWLGAREAVTLDTWKEYSGEGIRASTGHNIVLVGSCAFAGNNKDSSTDQQATVYVNFDNHITSFHLQTAFRSAMPETIKRLKENYVLSLLSGDNNRQKIALSELFGGQSDLCFEQRPADKLQYIEKLQYQGKRVIMIGDGLNDAGALQQSNVGITLAEDINNFTPACDAIFSADKIALLPSLLQLAKESTTIIRAAFIISIGYNIAGLYIAMHGQMKPVIAAILMPCSTLSIVIVSSGISNFLAWRKGLSIKAVGR